MQLFSEEREEPVVAAEEEAKPGVEVATELAVAAAFLSYVASWLPLVCSDYSAPDIPTHSG